MARFNPPLPLLVGAAVRETIAITCQGQTCLIAADYVSNNPANPALTDLQAFRTAFVAAVQTDLLATLPSTASIVSYTTAELRFSTTPTDVSVLGVPVPGTVSGQNLPLEMAAVIKKTSVVKGQHGRGRFALPAIPIGFTTPATEPNRLNSTAVPAYETFLDDLLSPITTPFGIWNWAILTRPTPPQALVLNGIAIAEYTVQTLLGTARRRREGRGE